MNNDFLDFLIIFSMGLQMQSYITNFEEPTNTDLMKKLDRIIELLETSLPRSTENTDSEDTRP